MGVKFRFKNKFIRIQNLYDVILQKHFDDSFLCDFGVLSICEMSYTCCFFIHIYMIFNFEMINFDRFAHIIFSSLQNGTPHHHTKNNFWITIQLSNHRLITSTVSNFSMRIIIDNFQRLTASRNELTPCCSVLPKN